MHQGKACTLIDAHSLPDDSTIARREDLFTYHSWHAEQASVNFWQAAFSWTLFWKTILMGERGDPCWMDHIMTPVATSPFLGFLDISCGRFTWDFQMELVYRLGEDNVERAVAFRKDWNMRKADSIANATKLRLPDGSNLLETIEAHAPYGDPYTLAVPVRAAYLLLKT